ncbi:hypothetical protein OAN24_04045 [Pseudodesulfovibrio sp.]|nr:hypothetical protein [Pseudodesulfovibrio sp.]
MTISTPSRSLAGKRILIFQQRGWGMAIGHDIARQLHEHGASLAALTFRHDVDRFVRDQDQVPYELILSNDAIMNNPEQLLGNDSISLDEVCENLELTSIWELVQSLRNHVKSYKDKFYYGFKQQASDEMIISYVKACYKCIRNVFDEFAPEFIVSPNFVALPHIMFNLYARKHGVPMTGISDSKVQDLLYFSYSYLEDRGPFIDRCAQIQQGADSPSLDKAQAYIAKLRNSFSNVLPSTVVETRNTMTQKAKAEILPYWFCLRYLLRKEWRYQDATGPTFKNPPPRYILRDHYARKRNSVAAESLSHYYDLDSLDDFAFFPLQYQPEESIDVHAARHNNQLETARQIAMSLPGDMTLAVKDHPEMVELRPHTYLEKLARTPNVKLLHYATPTKELLERTRLVIAPTGTTIFEAVLMHKPVVQLGPLGKTLMLPNVTHHTDFATLGEVITAILNQPMDIEEHDRKLDAYIAAMYDVGFTLDYYGVVEAGHKEHKQKAVDLFVNEALRHLAADSKSRSVAR